jgi:hypothetical protein
MEFLNFMPGLRTVTVTRNGSLKLIGVYKGQTEEIGKSENMAHENQMKYMNEALITQIV